MSQCNGLPAEKNALAYVEGSLSEAESTRFEEHYFQCPLCLAQVQALDAACEELAQHPIELPTTKLSGFTSIQSLFRPRFAWGLVAVSCLLLFGVIATMRYSRLATQNESASTAAPQIPTPHDDHSTAPLASPVAPEKIHAAQLADLVLPSFTASSLRSGQEELNFTDGMKAYNAGDCRAALPSLAQVPSTVKQSLAAHLYAGSCQMKLGNYAAADKELRLVEAAGDSPQLESALYELAQTALAQEAPSTAHQYLKKTIALNGDLESKARQQDLKVVALLNQSHPLTDKAHAGQGSAQ